MIRVTFTAASEHEDRDPGPGHEMPGLQIITPEIINPHAHDEEAILRRGILERLRENPRAYDITKIPNPIVH